MEPSKINWNKIIILYISYINKKKLNLKKIKWGKIKLASWFECFFKAMISVEQTKTIDLTT